PSARAGGHVLAINGEDIYVSVGAHDGVGAGSTLTLLHAIEAVDPTTNARLRDTFAIGKLTVVKAGEKVCLARAPQALLRRVRAGDEVSLASARRVFVDPWQEHIRRQRNQPQPGDPNARYQIARQRAEAQLRAAEQA